MPCATARRIIVLACVVLALSFMTAVASDHSGTVVAIDKRAGTLVIGEIGPWRVKDGETLVTRRTVAVTRSTEFVAASRSPDAGPSGWVGEWIEVPVDVSAVNQDDFITVRVRKAGRAWVADKVTIATP